MNDLVTKTCDASPIVPEPLEPLARLAWAYSSVGLILYWQQNAIACGSKPANSR